MSVAFYQPKVGSKVIERQPGPAKASNPPIWTVKTVLSAPGDGWSSPSEVVLSNGLDGTKSYAEKTVYSDALLPYRPPSTSTGGGFTSFVSGLKPITTGNAMLHPDCEGKLTRTTPLKLGDCTPIPGPAKSLQVVIDHPPKQLSEMQARIEASQKFADSPAGIAARLAWHAATIACAYHGYKRYGTIGKAVWWALGGTLFPIIALPVAFAQGFGKQQGASQQGASSRPALANPSKRRKSRKNPGRTSKGRFKRAR